MEKLDEKVYCSSCKQKTNHQILYTHSQSSEVNDDFHWHEKHHIAQCLGCDVICFVRQYGSEDMWDINSGEQVWVDDFTVYPEEPQKVSIKEKLEEKMFHRKAKHFKNAPESIQNLYNQIIESFSKGHDILCAAGLRTLIEGICTHLGIKKGYLYDENGIQIPDEEGIIRKHESLGGKIFELYDKKFIILHQALILQKVIKFGNDALHKMKTPSYYTLTEAVDIVEKVLYDIFELKNHSLLKKS
ncbi:uncharacterized protein DUF4145 [Cytobacillus firmus]|uniref:Uncharacterized protein DUF4145 n=2 Tax=Cytobacillus TaxID=2675230 RepID=A0A366K0U5_CYTFI|nr:MULTISPECIES: DUF4145 domain-containing protein [Cytobacillus]RBP95386.1 uncharacterized protein DUF4145 [Cytobacillus firmus]TDX44227.1 uncharacterized protein DUF4145 [Cytobacillus oceanisediminis]